MVAKCDPLYLVCQPQLPGLEDRRRRGAQQARASTVLLCTSSPALFLFEFMEQLGWAPEWTDSGASAVRNLEKLAGLAFCKAGAATDKPSSLTLGHVNPTPPEAKLLVKSLLEDLWAPCSLPSSQTAEGFNLTKSQFFLFLSSSLV